MSVVVSLHLKSSILTLQLLRCEVFHLLTGVLRWIWLVPIVLCPPRGSAMDAKVVQMRGGTVLMTLCLFAEIFLLPGREGRG